MSIAVVEVNRKSILHNIEFFKQKSPSSSLMAVVKANAYGHGMEGVAQLLDDKVDCFGVARISEAVGLRRVGIRSPIVLLEGFFRTMILMICLILIYNLLFIQVGKLTF